MPDILSLLQCLLPQINDYDNAPNEPNNPGHVSDEWTSHDALESLVGQALVVVTLQC